MRQGDRLYVRLPALWFLRNRLTVEKSLSAKSAVSSTLIPDTSTVALLNLCSGWKYTFSDERRTWSRVVGGSLLAVR